MEPQYKNKSVPSGLTHRELVDGFFIKTDHNRDVFKVIEIILLPYSDAQAEL